MGRETKILLTLLGLLAGVFFGVVSMKLFVPRPPAGAGPDVHGDVALAEAQDLVEPPDLTPSAGPPDLLPPAAIRPVDDAYAGRVSRFAAEPPAAEPPATEPAEAGADAPVRDPFVSRASFEVSPEVASTEIPSTPPPAAFVAPAFDPPAAPVEPAAPLPETPATGYVAQAGDSWWSIAERAYGDGRLYRALFAWNRVADPRLTLTPGTRLEIPPAANLAAAWPKLMPPD